MCRNAVILKSERSTAKFFRGHFGFSIIKSPSLCKRNIISTFRSRCLEKVTDYCDIKSKSGHSLQMLTHKVGIGFKVAPGSYLVQAPCLLLSLFSLQLFRMLLFYFVSVFATEAETLHQPNSTSTFLSHPWPPPATPAYGQSESEEGEHAGPACSTGSLSWHSCKECCAVAPPASQRPLCSEQPFRKQNGLVTAVCAHDEPVSYLVFLCFSRHRTRDRE